MREPKFQRRHYKKLAAVISGCHPIHTAAATGQTMRGWQALKVEMGNMLAMDNPRFDRGKFEEACEP